METGTLTWVLAVNLVIWAGIFLFLVRVDRKVRELEKKS